MPSGLELFPDGFRVRRIGLTVKLPAQQFHLLQTLYKARNRFVTRGHLIYDLWVNRDQEEPQQALNQISVIASLLRKKVAPLGVTIYRERGSGYQLRIDPSKRGFSATTVEPESCYGQKAT
jgi:DNA-binding response OmpR family regulator